MTVCLVEVCRKALTQQCVTHTVYRYKSADCTLKNLHYFLVCVCVCVQKSKESLMHVVLSQFSLECEGVMMPPLPLPTFHVENESLPSPELPITRKVHEEEVHDKQEEEEEDEDEEALHR